MNEFWAYFGIVIGIVTTCVAYYWIRKSISETEFRKYYLQSPATSHTDRKLQFENCIKPTIQYHYDILQNRNRKYLDYVALIKKNPNMNKELVGCESDILAGEVYDAQVNLQKLCKIARRVGYKLDIFKPIIVKSLVG